MTTPLADDVLEALRRYDTPTICNALEALDSSYRTQGFTKQPLVCAFPQLPPIVGYAKTATMRAMCPSELNPESSRDMRFRYYDYICAEPNVPRILVIQDVDSQVGFGAYWGEVQTNLHRALGCVGGITNGSIRDLDEMAPNFQMLAGSIAPAHAWVHLHSFAESVDVCGMHTRDGDLVHADRHGAAVIPRALAPRVKEMCEKQIAREKVILDACRAPQFKLDALKQAIIQADQKY